MWQHTIRNACKGHILPHPLYDSITIFDIHNNSHFTTIITNNHPYYCCYSLSLCPLQAISFIHTTIRQCYAGLLPIASPLTQHITPSITIKSTPTQIDDWACGIHPLLINLATIYQGDISSLKHTQAPVAAILFIIHLIYVFTREIT